MVEFIFELVFQVILEAIGQVIFEVAEKRGMDQPALFSFRAGAIFAFGMALVRFIYLEHVAAR